MSATILVMNLTGLAQATVQSLLASNVGVGHLILMDDHVVSKDEVDGPFLIGGAESAGKKVNILNLPPAVLFMCVQS